MASSELHCPFYKADVDQKGQVLQDRIDGLEEENGSVSSWIVATGALGMGINIEGIAYVIYIDRLYGTTSFVQQSGRGGCSNELSDSIIIVRVKTTSARRRKEVLVELLREG